MFTSFAALAASALAQAQNPPDAANPPAQTADKPTAALDSVIVTGTRVSDRTVAESISPIDVITPEILQSTGTSDLATALTRALPSLNYPRSALGTEGTDAVRPMQLRGLSPDQTLVLVNGKRRHTSAQINISGVQGRGSAPADLNAIPIAAIERVEVLRDGASAQYGSDAIAGVINIVLKGSDHGGSVEARYGKYSAGDGEQEQIDGDAGFKLGEAGSVHVAGQLSDNDTTNRARPFTGTRTLTSPPSGQVVQRSGEPQVKLGAVSLNGNYRFSEAIDAYAFGTASNRDVLTNGFFRSATDPRNVPEIYPNGYLPQAKFLSQDHALVAGLHGTLASGWKWDLSYNYGYNHLTENFRNNLNRSLGTASPTSFYGGALEKTQNVLNADLSRAVEVSWLPYPLTMAIGAEYRDEKFNQSPGERASYVNGGVIAPDGNYYVGTQLSAGYRPEDSGSYNRNNTSLYADFEADLSDKLSAGVAARYEDYSDFGSTTSGKLSARYAVNDAVAFRATVSSGFRAPSLQQQHFQSTATNFIGGVPFSVRTFATADPVAKALGAEPLRPEKSLNYSVGTVLRPVEDLSLTIDAYQIDVDDRITLSEDMTGTAVAKFLAARGFPGVNGGRYFTNAVDTRTRGVDLVGSYRWQLENSTFDLTFGYNYTDTKVRRVAPNPAVLDAGGLVGLVRIGRVELGRITRGYPKDKLNLSGLWQFDHWRFMINPILYGKHSVLVGQVPATPNRDQTFGSKWVTDASATYLRGNWEFTLGVDNMFNTYPDEVLFANSTGGQLPYPNTSPLGFGGAFVYGNVKFRWQ
ncbi:MAG: TonB-dependent receptor [Rudaea sp.]|nr:TonB-dependent receptor [Rudaea sp.]